jgi:transposase
LKSGLVEAAWSVSKTRTFLGSKFWSLAHRRGKNKAAVAIAHKMLVIAYHVLKDKVPYRELGSDYLEKRRATTQEESMIRRLEKLGYTINKSEERTSA